MVRSTIKGLLLKGLLQVLRDGFFLVVGVGFWLVFLRGAFLIVWVLYFGVGFFVCFYKAWVNHKKGIWCVASS